MRTVTVILLIVSTICILDAMKSRADVAKAERDLAEAIRIGHSLNNLLEWYRVWEEGNANHAWYVWDPKSGRCMFCDQPAIHLDGLSMPVFCDVHKQCSATEDGNVWDLDGNWLWLKYNVKITAYEVTGHGQPSHGDPSADFRPWIAHSIPFSEAFAE